MPELPEVETVVQGLRPILEGAVVQAVLVHRADLRWPVPADFGQRLGGARLLRLARRAKYGLIETDRGDTLIFHLGMSGRMRLDPGDRRPHDHVEFLALAADGPHRVAFNDPRRFGSFHLAPTDRCAMHPLLAGLGPEPLEDGFTGRTLAEAARGRATTVKALILDQRVVAGIGNIYASEALFRARIHPCRRAGRISAARYDRLAASLKSVLMEAIAAGGSTLRDHAGIRGELGYFQHQFMVYGRDGDPCPSCAAPVRRRTLAGRSSFFCSQCQR
ncbi:bifunctional DNA-formamidopyrimidine glycosylase/DNA-(apurinic or apyrimidinic site) lyase [Thermaurantiacus sp.]